MYQHVDPFLLNKALRVWNLPVQHFRTRFATMAIRWANQLPHNDHIMTGMIIVETLEQSQICHATTFF